MSGVSNHAVVSTVSTSRAVRSDVCSVSSTSSVNSRAVSTTVK